MAFPNCQQKSYGQTIALDSQMNLGAKPTLRPTPCFSLLYLLGIRKFALRI
jgi:hypothetical protein